MTQTVLSAIQGCTGRLSLNRPKAIHALDLDMVLAMTASLIEWLHDPKVEAVIIDHAEGRGFCAGGDVVTIARSAQGTGAAARAFFFNEYRLNHLLFSYPKPTAVFMDGVTMGGGVGISRPCRYRIATDRTLFAMPETSIGLFPDVGGGWHLSRLLGRLPQYLALTGARLDGAECFALGLATHYVEHGDVESLKADIARDPNRIDAYLAHAQAPPPPARIKQDRDKICRLFEADSLERIIADLRADGSDWALKQVETLRRKSPTACKVSLRLLEKSSALRDFAGEMGMEYALMAHVSAHPDFAEGVRALLVDKDNEPLWRPASPEEVTEEMVEKMFDPLAPEDSWSPLPLGSFE
ncbi:MAG TPA: enoyl-CoA hydratase/isomerase family protein [Allosphingosinicella sp.]|nr:enoyl-CoA hydratase/isomerase family protein [Allosphingosinicella sp.]